MATIGEEHMRAGKYAEAIKVYEKIMENPTYENILSIKFDLAWAYYLTGAFEKAIPLFTDLSSVRAPSATIKAQALFLLADCYARLAATQDEKNADRKKNIQKALEGKGYKVTFFDMNESPLPIQKIQESDADIIFNVCERINNSSLLEPNAASLLDILQIPYTGSSPFTLALCIDKIKAKKLLSYNDIPTPEWDYIYSLDEGIDEDLKYPLIVKPANTDNSIGITNESVVTDEKELLRQLEKVIIEYKRPALVEEYIDGDEYDVTIIGNGDNLKVLPLSRSIFDDLPEGYWHIYPFQAKWAKDGEGTVYNKIRVERPAKVPKNLAELISEIAVDTYNILGCHDYGRVEIRTDQNSNPYVLELNPNPSINVNDSTVASAELIGLNYADFIEEIIKMAIKRYKEKPPYYHLQSLYI